MSDLIEKLSNLRSQFNCFDEDERDAYNTLSEAIKALSERHEPCKDDKGCSNCMYSGRPTYKSPCSECRDNSQWEMKPISRSHENSTEYDDTISRQRLLNDLEKLITAWKKYPVMAEQIKGVETAIEYVEMITSVTPNRETGEWITNLYAFGEDRYECDQCHNTALHCYDFCPNCGADMRGEENE